MLKFFYLFMLAGALAGLIWTINVGGADGSPLAIIAPLALGGGTAAYYQRRTGSMFNERA